MKTAKITALSLSIISMLFFVLPKSWLEGSILINISFIFAVVACSLMAFCIFKEGRNVHIVIILMPVISLLINLSGRL